MLRRCWMIHSTLGCGVTLQWMENLAPLVLDDKEAIQDSERHRRHGEEIEGSDYLAVILEKGELLLTGITTRLAVEVRQLRPDGPPARQFRNWGREPLLPNPPILLAPIDNSAE